MRFEVRRVVGCAAAAAVTVLPVALGSFGPTLTPTAATLQPRASASADVSTAPLAVGLPAPQEIEPQTTIDKELVLGKSGKLRVDSAKGTRVWTASALADHNVPEAALRAYETAAATMGRLDPACQVPWTLLAGIGRVESDHGRYGGSVLAADGVSRPAIIGIALNGVGPVAAIADTDNGRLDRDQVWDRAVGPMQFIPSTWRYAGRDGDGDGVKNPHDLDDAALAAASYLCSGSGSVLPEAAMKAAIFRYNPSDYYVALVMAFERGYRTGAFALPSPPAPTRSSSGDARPTARRHHTVRPHATTPKPTQQTRTSKPASRPTSSPTTSTTKPSPTPSPTPTPTPTPTLELEPRTGALATCETASWCLDGVQLDLGPDTQLAATAAADFDGDGTLESNSDELAGLAAAGPVTVSVKQGTAAVYLIAGKGYRNPDGTFAR